MVRLGFSSAKFVSWRIWESASLVPFHSTPAILIFRAELDFNLLRNDENDDGADANPKQNAPPKSVGGPELIYSSTKLLASSYPSKERTGESSTLES